MPKRGSASDQVRELQAAYKMAQTKLDLPPGSVVMRRVFASQLEPTQEALAHSSLLGAAADPAAVSVVEEPPLPDRSLALWAYHVCAAPLDKQAVQAGVQLVRGHQRHIWTCSLTDEAGAGSASEQTRKLFDRYARWLESQGASLGRDVLRTWVYVADIRADYAEMVDARRALFAEHGLTADTHSIASTGIAGRCGPATSRVALDAYAVVGLHPDQVRFLSAPSHLGPAAAYGATFERGTEICYGDRRHVLVSGTASISPSGEILFVGDAGSQAKRALENVEALLHAASARLEDVAIAIVYLRCPEDHETVERVVQERLDQIPTIFLHAEVCREQWLVEVECVAALSPGDARWAPF